MVSRGLRLQVITLITSRRWGTGSALEFVAGRSLPGNELVVFDEVRLEPSIYRERRPPADFLASANRQLVIDIDDVHTLAQGIVDTIRDPLLVLDQHLRVVTANRAFCQTFRMTRQNIEDRAVYALGDEQWNIPALRFLLENIALLHTVMDGYEVEREFPGIGRRLMLVNAREVVSQEMLASSFS